jgi:N-acetylglucosaminyldiphosphoundecaprenol N-acetyl-beta-D-mannosaminyltransferase
MFRNKGTIPKNEVKIAGISCYTVDFNTIADLIIESAINSQKKIFVHLNMHNFSILNKHPEFLKLYLSECLLFFEGIGMKIAALLTLQGWCSDTNGTDLFPILFSKLSKNNFRIFLLGGTQNVLVATIQKINSKYPQIEIVGSHNGFFSEFERPNICKLINDSKPDLLILGMGMKNESEFLVNSYNTLKVPTIWCVGGLFDFISERFIRAPKILRKLRMEWMFRFILEPKAKFKRTFISPFWFFSKVLIYKYVIKF